MLKNCGFFLDMKIHSIHFVGMILYHILEAMVKTAWEIWNSYDKVREACEKAVSGGCLTVLEQYTVLMNYQTSHLKISMLQESFTKEQKNRKLYYILYLTVSKYFLLFIKECSSGVRH